MGGTMFISCYVFLLVYLSLLISCSARDTITSNTSLSDKKGDTLVSSGRKFELGFFNARSDGQRYVGIWYYGLSVQTLIWVANRDKPLSFLRDGVLEIYDGNLRVRNGSGIEYWSTKLEPYGGYREAKLSDSGNLIFCDQQGQSVWQSFEDPTDTFLPGMNMDEKLVLTSWKSQDDPGKGSFTFNQLRENRFVISNDSEPYWRSDLFYMENSGYLLSTFSSSNRSNPCAYFNYGRMVMNTSCSYEKSPKLDYNNRRMVMNSSGEIQLWNLFKDRKQWHLQWSEPRDQCSVVNACGDLGKCSNSTELACECLPGYKPKSLEEWNRKKFSGGCVKKSEGFCQNDTFLNLTNIRVETPQESPEAGNEAACKNYCLSSCPCQAYSYTGGGAKRYARMNCFIWNSIKNFQEYPADGGAGDLVNLSVRVTPSNIETSPIVQSGPPSRGEIPVSRIAVGATIAGIIVISSTIVFIYILMRKKARKQEGEENINRTAELLYGTEKRLKDMISSEEFKEEDKKGIDVPFFDFESIIAATGNFSDANKLGRGGFGPVYKGTFPGGLEVAIKRLSSVSGQGLEEFKNEVVLIAKLQHRNLVRLLGYCIKGDEKLLIYEYMRNRSLDFFIFEHGAVLNWEARFNIILGVARGLLYLHQDSRLRIIHRDLKTGNILLDDEMNPKISDFGLARIFEGKQTEGTTNRVIGTYGYMSPEYALDGLFSVKSDAFSFGVVLLEILSGKRNTGYFQAMHNTSLLGYAWRLWTEGLALDLMDEMVRESCDRSEFLKCVNVALLCVQDDPADRPTMSNVVVMLSSETSTLPNPKQPAFTVTRDVSETTSSSKQEIVTSSKYWDSPRD